jgi:uracil-DNA glycosylase family 4
MNDLFKENLLKLRHPIAPSSFAQALLGSTPFLRSQSNKSPHGPSSSNFSEKVQVLESLERYAHEKMQESGLRVLSFHGGEISKKSDPVWQGIHQSESVMELQSELNLDPLTKELIFANKVPGQIKIIFVTENFRPYEDYQSEMGQGVMEELLPAFPLKTADLFGRMLGAMKLERSEVIISPSGTRQEDISAAVMGIVAFYRPEIIVTLGATPTHRILKSQERLAQVHGQFFQRKIENVGTFNVVPLFHPSIIESNLNMKKTAWADMQKIMKHLKKL